MNAKNIIKTNTIKTVAKSYKVNHLKKKNGTIKIEVEDINLKF